MKSGDLVKYVGYGWPQKGTVGIVIAMLHTPSDLDPDYTVKVCWAARDGMNIAWEDPKDVFQIKV